MATLTKKDLLEAIEDMPMDAEIYMRDPEGYYADDKVDYVECDTSHKRIVIC